MIDADTGRALAELALELEFRTLEEGRVASFDGQTDAEGRFLFPGTIDRAGEFLLRAVLDQGRFRGERRVDARVWATDPDSPLELGDLLVSRREGYRLYVLAADGLPIGDAEVSALATVPSETSKEFEPSEECGPGCFEFFPTEEAPPEVMVVRDGFWPTSSRFSPGSGELTVVMPRTLEQQRVEEISVPGLAAGGEVTVDLVSRDGHPISGAKIYARFSSYPGVSSPDAISDAKGRFTLKNVLGGAAYLKVDHPDFVPAIYREVEFNTPGTARRIELLPSVPFELFVDSASGIPQSCGEVFVESAEAVPELPIMPFRRPREISPGHYVFQRLPIGLVRISCKALPDGGLSAGALEFDTRDGVGHVTLP